MKRACYLQLRLLSRIQRYLTYEAAEKLTHAFVTSRLDNLNSLLINTPSFQVQQLHLIQNTPARIVTQERKFCTITPILKDLHWLPVEARIEFKTLLHVYRCVNGIAPEYMTSCLTLTVVAWLDSSPALFSNQSGYILWILFLSE